MTVKQHIGWPWTDGGPIVEESEARSGRFRVLTQIKPREHKLRQGLGVPVKESLFELGTQTLEMSLRIAIRENVRIYEPGVLIPAGADGITLDQVGENFYLNIRYTNLDIPAPKVDETTIRIR